MQLEFGRYELTCDSLNWIISERKTRRDGARAGEEYSEAYGFYPRLSSALGALLDLKLTHSNARSVEDLLAEIRRAEAHITKTAIQLFPKDARRLATDTEKNNSSNHNVSNEYAIPYSILEELSDEDYELIERRRKGRGYTAVVTISPLARERIIAHLQGILDKQGSSSIRLAAKRTLSVLQGG